MNEDGYMDDWERSGGNIDFGVDKTKKLRSHNIVQIIFRGTEVSNDDDKNVEW